MRVKLAVNTLSLIVADEMKAHENNVTESTQRYITMCHNLWQVFDDRRPISAVRDPALIPWIQYCHFFLTGKLHLFRNLRISLRPQVILSLGRLCLIDKYSVLSICIFHPRITMLVIRSFDGSNVVFIRDSRTLTK